MRGAAGEGMAPGGGLPTQFASDPVKPQSNTVALAGFNLRCLIVRPIHLPHRPQQFAYFLPRRDAIGGALTVFRRVHS